jgi:hypothetical protein
VIDIDELKAAGRWSPRSNWPSRRRSARNSFDGGGDGVVGALLHINPFDEPDVQQAKIATRTPLDRYKSEGACRSLRRIGRSPMA